MKSPQSCLIKWTSDWLISFSLNHDRFWLTGIWMQEMFYYCRHYCQCAVPPPQPPPSSDWACTLIITHYHSSTQRHAFTVSFVLCSVLATSTADHNAKHERGLIKPGCGSVLPGTRHYIYSLRRHQAAAAPSRAKAPVDYMQIKMTWVQDVKRHVRFINSSTRRADAFTQSVLTKWIEELGVSGKCLSNCH